MRVGLDAFPAVSPFGGVANYTCQLLKFLPKVSHDTRFFAYVPTGCTAQIKEKFSEIFDAITWKEVHNWTYGRQGRLDRLDIFHGTNFKCQTPGRYGTVLTIHDLWLDRHPEHSKKLLGQHLSYYRTRKRAQQCSRIIAVSPFTSSEVQDLYGIPKDKITVIPHGVSQDFFPNHNDEQFHELRQAIGLPECPYILFLGGANPRKNHSVLFHAFGKNPVLRNNYVIVVVGNQKFKTFSIYDTVREAGLSGKIVTVEHVSRSDLRILYSRAALFVFPSKYEGFGFPVLEAMACGVPVITSDCSALPEVAGDAAVLVNPENVDGLSAAMVKVLDDPAFQQRLQEKGKARIAQFSWERTAKKTFEVYRHIYEAGLE